MDEQRQNWRRANLATAIFAGLALSAAASEALAHKPKPGCKCLIRQAKAVIPTEPAKPSSRQSDQYRQADQPDPARRRAAPKPDRATDPERIQTDGEKSTTGEQRPQSRGRIVTGDIRQTNVASGLRLNVPNAFRYGSASSGTTLETRRFQFGFLWPSLKPAAEPPAQALARTFTDLNNERPRTDFAVRIITVGASDAPWVATRPELAKELKDAHAAYTSGSDTLANKGVRVFRQKDKDQLNHVGTFVDQKELDGYFRCSTLPELERDGGNLSRFYACDGWAHNVRTGVYFQFQIPGALLPELADVLDDAQSLIDVWSPK